MSTFVLVPGFWLGAWAWREVAVALRAQGHDVYPLSLTGLGEHSHLARPDIDLETHVSDVLNLLRYEELEQVVLVGHSYAGAVVIPSVADRVPERIAQLVFIDSGPLPTGMSQSQFLPPDEQARNAELVRAAGNGWQLPPPAWHELAASVPGLQPATFERLSRLSVPQPWATATSPVRLNGAWQRPPRVAVLCSFTVEQLLAMAGTVPAFQHMTGDGWTYRELPGWHWPMFDRPGQLARVLHETAPHSPPHQT
ncbi:MAG: alpha/beta fold hydrolase [Mycobacterium sp.]|nr:alpha/beta fold hydrolase [Mycobacterium sp.]